MSAAALNFESRWTMLALKRVDADLAERLHDQRNRFVEACISGTDREVAREGAAMCRGYRAVTAAMENSEPDDAYQLGEDPATGLMVAIGSQKAAEGRVHELYGDKVIFISPDEVATLFATVGALKSIGEIKTRFPGAEIVQARKLSQGS
ncbi:hypothetical protein [Bradyrhizobium elkanii]|uniref:hypothetical protein n=1 Tax=Bradyrhizobium elkanii TaxID=29448 RepID=UPI0012FD5573|nr:hypothetical protein [Bradyrhizobium elkanii]WLA79596.1 hypothetical protein QNJ99_29895 [Bradyrhizobium elkanii]